MSDGISHCERRCSRVQIRVICGDEECRREFPVSTSDAQWECPACGRTIVNRRYPFLTARLMQGTIDKENADWKALFEFLLERAELEISDRSIGIDHDLDLDFLDEARRSLEREGQNDNSYWKELHDRLLERGREAVLRLDAIRKEKGL